MLTGQQLRAKGLTVGWPQPAAVPCPGCPPTSGVGHPGRHPRCSGTHHRHPQDGHRGLRVPGPAGGGAARQVREEHSLHFPGVGAAGEAPLAFTLSRQKPTSKQTTCPEYHQWKHLFWAGGYSPHDPGMDKPIELRDAAPRNPQTHWVRGGGRRQRPPVDSFVGSPPLV